MANWVLSVDLRGTGGTLVRELRESAQHAASLGRASKTTKTELKELGAAARTTGTALRALARDAERADRSITRMGSATRVAAGHLGRYGAAARDADRHLGALAVSSRSTAQQLARMNGQMTAAIRDMTRLAAAARAAGTRVGTVGDGGHRSLSRLESTIGRVRGSMGGLVSMLAGGALIMGGAEIIKTGNEMSGAMNEFQGVTSGTAMQMARAGAVATQLGGDLRLPKTTATDAAHAMVELAKAGFRTDQAITATRASLLLSTAAHLNAADSAKYLGDIMDQFGLSSDQAAVAADTLAATANSASGGVTEIYYAMKYAGPVAHGMGVSMQDAASGVGMMAKAGILGSTAGTALRGMFVNMAKPTDKMSEGLQTLGIEAWDAQGRFKGLRYVIEKLEKAQHHLTQQDFTAAAAKAFGKPALSGAVALAHQGVQSFDALSIAVRQSGAAEQIAAAQGKGLTGAMKQLHTQSKATGLAIYQGVSPGLEYLTRGITKTMADATPHITEFFNYLNAAAVLFGPDIKKSIGRIFADIKDEASGLGDPFKALAVRGGGDALHILLDTGRAVVTVLKNIVKGAEPIVHALGDVAGESDGAANSLEILMVVLHLLTGALSSVSGVLVPIGRVVGTLVTAFGHLPGPVQSAVLSMLLFRRVGPMLSGLATGGVARVTGAFRGLGAQMAVQRTLAASAGVTLTRYGAAFAVLQTRVPIIGSMAASFRTASAAGTGFAGSLRGVTAAAGAGMRGAMSGMVGALGGPWGAAITGGVLLLGLWASAQQRASAEVAQHKSDVENLTSAMRASNDMTSEGVRQAAAQAISNAKLKTSHDSLTSVLSKAGISLQATTDAYLGQGASISGLTAELDVLADKQKAVADAAGKGKKFGDEGAGFGDAMKLYDQYKEASKTLQGMSGDAAKAAKSAKDLNAAVKGAGGGTSAYDHLKDAVGALADRTGDADTRTRALKEALDLLSGGSLSYQAAQLKLNEAITQANDSLGEGVSRADGFGKALLQVNGTLDTTSKNGQQLYGSLTSIAEGGTQAALAAYDLADAQGKPLAESLKAAQTEMEKARTAGLKLAGQYGLNAAQAKTVADAMGLIPGQVAILLETKGVDSTMAELIAVQAQLAQTPGAKSITVSALSEEARAKLIALGFQIAMIPGTRQFTVTVPDANPKAAIASIQAAINGMHGTTLTVTTLYTSVGQKAHANDADHNGISDFVQAPQARGSVIDYFADGGMRRPRENHVAQIAPAGAWRVWGEPETGGESYIPLSPAKRTRSRAIAEETIRRLGGKNIQWNANGNITDWRYDPVSGSLYSAADATQAGHKTRKVVTKTRSKKGKITTSSKDVDYWDEAAFERQLGRSSTAAHRWNVDLATVANRVGGDVANALAAMGAEGVELTHKMATGTTKYVNQMAGSLRELAKTARASLTDYARQLNSTNATTAQFQNNLTKLAGLGYGDLAAQLGSQNDLAAQQMAVDALLNKGMARNANAAAKKANSALTSDEVLELIRIIGAVTSSRVGVHGVADTTGLGEDEIVAVAGKATAQIRAALGGRGTKFLADLTRAQRGLSYADGGIRPGVYSTRGGAVTFAEPSTGGEAYIPLGSNKRGKATRVLHDVAGQFGLGLTPAGGSGRPIVIIRETGGTTVHVPVTRTNATATDIATQVARQVRRARRGGVAARG